MTLPTPKYDEQQRLDIAASPALMALTASNGKWRLARHHDLVDQAILDLIHRRIPQRILMVREPPRHGKSEHLCHWTPAWYEGSYPDREVIVCGHGNKFARKFGRRSRNTFGEVAPHVWGVGLDPDRQAADNWGTTEGGGVITAGIGGGIGGEGASLLIVDDLIKDAKKASSESYRDDCWDWFVSTAWTRLSPVGVCIVIGTSWHRDDYQQRIKREFPDEVLDICLPAIAEENDLLGREVGEALWPDQWGLEWLEQQQKIEGPYYWNALYQQRPSQNEAAEWPAEYFDGIFVDAMPDAFELTSVGVDPSKGRQKGDYSAIVAAGTCGGLIFVDSIVERMPAEKIIRVTANQAMRYGAEMVGIEAIQFQELLAAELNDYLRRERLPAFNVAPLIDNTPKEIRIRRLGGWLAQKRLRFLNTPGNRLLVEQLKDFPLGDHDDGPDALEMAIRMLSELAAYAQTSDFVETI